MAWPEYRHSDAGVFLCAGQPECGCTHGHGVGAGAYYGAIGTIGTLALILVYMGVTGAHGTRAWSEPHSASAVAGWLAVGWLRSRRFVA